MAITHSKVSDVVDGGDTDLVRPSDWNDDHVDTVSLDSVAGTLADDGTTDNGALLTTYLASAGNGTYALGSHPGHVYGLTQPIIVANGQTLLGMGSMQGGTTFQLQTGFPTTTTSGGDQVTPADTTTTFTLNVISTSLFPMAAGKIDPANGIGVLCCTSDLGYCITIFYTGVTATSFTGCRVGASDINATIANGSNVGTFAVWLTDPGDTSGGFGTRLEHVGIDFNDIAASSGIHSSHIQEGAGVFDVRVWKYKCFGIRLDSAPSMSGSVQCVNYALEKLWIIASSTPETGCIGIDEMHSYVGTHTVRLDSQRGVKDVTFTTQASASATGYAGMRINAGTGTYADIHMECQNVGIMVGDLYASAPVISNVWIGGTWGSPAGNNGGICLADIATNSAYITQVGKAGSAPGLRVIVDGVNGSTQAANTISSYVLLPSGAALLNGGGPYLGVPTAALVEDNVASGARTGSSASTLTVTFTATTAVGNTLLLAANSSGNRTLASVADSRGNTWQVDAVKSGQGVTANIASCAVTIAHQISDTLTLTYSGADTEAAGIVSEWSGLEPASWLDQTASDNGSSGNGSTGVTGTRSQADELLFAAIGYNNASDKTAGAGFTPLSIKSSGGGNRKIFPEYQIVSEVGTDAATWVGDLGAHDEVIATYKVAATSGTRFLRDDLTWATPAGGTGDVATDAIFDAKGDLAVGTGANTAAKLTAGADDTVLMAASGEATGLKWVASATPSTQAFGDAAATGTSDTFTRGDHKHAMPTSTTGPDADVTVDSAGAAGTADTAARAGHGHQLATSSSNPVALGTVGPGTSGHAPSRDDHVHPTTGLAADPHGAAQHTDITRSVWAGVGWGAGSNADGGSLANTGSAPSRIATVGMADGSSQGWSSTMMLPADAKAATALNAVLYWLPGSTDASAHTARWSMEAYIEVAGVAADTAGTTVAWTGDSAARTAKFLVIESSVQILASTSANDLIRFSIRRVGADGADSYVGAINFVGIRWDYTATG